VIQRIRIAVRGAVQGVGFRPFVYRLATELRLNGWVLNSSQGVFIEAEGEPQTLRTFLLRLQAETPPRSFLQSVESSFLDPVLYRGFEIRPSEPGGVPRALVLPDIATCPACLTEIFDPRDRRHLYPFTNCTHCGPRYSILEALPYDRANTSMRAFAMCTACRTEYENPVDRRFHAQPNACPECGPSLQLWDAQGGVLAARHDALRAAADALRAGQVVAVKGLGGFHLMVDARDESAVLRLRERKHREEKPLAVMFPALEAAAAACEVSPLEERLLTAPESPIVLLRRRAAPRVGVPATDPVIAPAVAPRNPYLGGLLPYTPLHHILMRELGFPVVATSGNRAEEPICINEGEAVERLRGIADLFLVHDRPIVRHVDDSIARVILDRELVLRRARGYAPLPVPLGCATPPLLAVGGQLKNTVALTVDGSAFISQHIGDLENREAIDAFRRVVADLCRLYAVQPQRVAADAHPDYVSTRNALRLGLPVTFVQHHYAHVAACMAENELDGAVLGVSWDGTGYGLDGTIWGGEFLRTDDVSFARVAALRAFRLPGSVQAVKEPRRAALGLLFELFGAQLLRAPALARLPTLRAFADRQRAVLLRMLAAGVQSPVTSSAGRLFDAVASLLDLRQTVAFEGQAAMELEFAARAAGAWDGDDGGGVQPYPFAIERPAGADGAAAAGGAGSAGSAGSASRAPTADGGPRAGDHLVVEWAPMVRAILEDVGRGTPVGPIARRFHETLACAIVEVARRVGEPRVVLSGGCFQNALLTERTVRRLQQAGFRPYWHQRVPPNDGGLALGQAYAVARALRPTAPGASLAGSHAMGPDAARADTAASDAVRAGAARSDTARADTAHTTLPDPRKECHVPGSAR
jgi:hydrogenase maturation protein HypF